MRSLRDIWVLILSLVLSGVVCAQDLERIAERSLTGTARYVGLAGAMTAIGGDPTAVMDNPAGLGVYRRMEVSATTDAVVDNTLQVNTNNYADATAYSFSQFSWVINLPSTSASGIVSNSLMFGYQRQRTFNRSYRAGYTGEYYSIMDVAAMMTNGVPEDKLQEKERWDNPNLGWLSVLGYENYLIDPAGDKKYTWLTPLQAEEQVNNLLNVTESGYQNAYSLTWAMNYAHRLYFGAGLDVQSLSFRRSSKYSENPALGGMLYNEATLQISGIGTTFRTGILYRPSRWVRFGLAFHTPSLTKITISNYGYMEARMKPGETTLSSCETPSGRSAMTGFYQPMRLSAGVALQLLDYGLLSMQYDFSHSRYTMNQHTLKVGLEAVAVRRVMLDLGFAYRSSFHTPAYLGDVSMYYDDYAESYALPSNSIRTDTDFQRLRSAWYVGTGVGYHGRWGTVHAAYQFSREMLDLYAHEYAAPYDMRATTHRILLTLNWHTN